MSIDDPQRIQRIIAQASAVGTTSFAHARDAAILRTIAEVAEEVAARKELILSDVTYYIDPVLGNDANVGTAAGAPLKTMGSLAATLRALVIPAGITVTVQLAAGIYHDVDPASVGTGSTALMDLRGIVIHSAGTLAIRGDVSTPTNVQLRGDLTTAPTVPDTDCAFQLDATCMGQVSIRGVDCKYFNDAAMLQSQGFMNIFDCVDNILSDNNRAIRTVGFTASSIYERITANNCVNTAILIQNSYSVSLATMTVTNSGNRGIDLSNCGMVTVSAFLADFDCSDNAAEGLVMTGCGEVVFSISTLFNTVILSFEDNGGNGISLIGVGRATTTITNIGGTPQFNVNRNSTVGIQLSGCPHLSLNVPATSANVSAAPQATGVEAGYGGAVQLVSASPIQGTSKDINVLANGHIS